MQKITISQFLIMIIKNSKVELYISYEITLILLNIWSTF